MTYVRIPNISENIDLHVEQIELYNISSVSRG